MSIKNGQLFVVVGMASGDRSYDSMIFRAESVTGSSIVARIMVKAFSWKVDQVIVFNHKGMELLVVPQSHLDAALGKPTPPPEPYQTPWVMSPSYVGSMAQVNDAAGAHVGTVMTKDVANRIINAVNSQEYKL